MICCKYTFSTSDQVKAIYKKPKNNILKNILESKLGFLNF